LNIQEFDFSIDLLQAILWEYNDASAIQSLLNSKQAWYTNNQTIFWDNWFIDVFNLASANSFGLCVWSIILNLPLFLNPTPDPVGKPIWGFGIYNKNFEHGNFTSSQGDIITLTDAQRRIVLQLYYFKLTSRCAIPEINAFLNYAFQEHGSAYVLDNLKMEIEVVFRFNIDANLLLVIQEYDLIPRAAGVGIRYTVDLGTVWGFGSFNQNFQNGNFIEEVSL